MDASDLSRFVALHGLQAEVIHLPQHTPTVQVAAHVLGTGVERIAKSVLFLVNGDPVLVIASGTARVDRGKVATFAGVGRKKVRLADAETVAALTGFEVGAMPPFGHKQRLKTLLDRRVLEQPEVWAGGGSVDALLRVKPMVIQEVTGADVVDVVEQQFFPGREGPAK